MKKRELIKKAIVTSLTIGMIFVQSIISTNAAWINGFTEVYINPYGGSFRTLCVFEKIAANKSALVDVTEILDGNKNSSDYEKIRCHIADQNKAMISTDQDAVVTLYGNTRLQYIDYYKNKAVAHAELRGRGNSSKYDAYVSGGLIQLDN